MATVSWETERFKYDSVVRHCNASQGRGRSRGAASRVRSGDRPRFAPVGRRATLGDAEAIGVSGSHLDRGAERRRLLRAIDVDADDERYDSDRHRDEPTPIPPGDDGELVALADDDPTPAVCAPERSASTDDGVGSTRPEPASRRTALAVRPFLDESAEDGDA